MFLPAVLLYLGIDPLHQSVPLHQHVGEGGAGEDPDHLGAGRRQVVQTARKDPINDLFVSR